MIQLFACIFGVLAIASVYSEKEMIRKWAPVFGLAGQPFWFYETYDHEQWGFFFLTVAYTGLWLKGLAKMWFDVEMAFWKKG